MQDNTVSGYILCINKFAYGNNLVKRYILCRFLQNDDDYCRLVTVFAEIYANNSIKVRESLSYVYSETVSCWCKRNILRGKESGCEICEVACEAASEVSEHKNSGVLPVSIAALKCSVSGSRNGIAPLTASHYERRSLC